MPRLRTYSAAVIALVSPLLVGDLGARAQVGEDVPELGSTTTTTAPPGGTSTTTTVAPPPPEPGPAPAPTTPPPGQTPPSEPPPRGPAPGPPPPPAPEGGGDAVEPANAPMVVPPEYEALIRSVRRSRPNSTRALLLALRPLEDLGHSTRDVAVMGMGRFPVAGYATFTDDWWMPRFVPYFHLHEGTDIFAPAGTPVRSPADGTLRQSNSPVGGLSVYVTQDDGTYFYLAHLAGFAGQANGQRVKVGEVVGFVGDSGNARGGPPHLHFEIHPTPTRTVTTGRGKARRTEVVHVRVPPGTRLAATNPKPYLDNWLNEAMADAPRLVAAYTTSRPRAVVATGLTRRFSPGATTFSGLSGPPRAQLLWASSANPSGGALALAEAEAARVAASVDWDHRARVQRAQQVGGGQVGAPRRRRR
jgi:murein DD-endopeptidase MepM/ murein hydrolase activator NlpD